MVNVTLPAVRFAELIQILDKISPKDLNDLKAIRVTSNLVNDLKAALKEYGEKYDALQVKQASLAGPFQERYKVESQGKTDAENEALAAELDAELSKQVSEVFKEELKELSELGSKEITVELGNDKHEKLKELFKQHAIPKYLNKEVLIKVADALQVE